ncbi:GNAT family N-acetyltransferase [Niabella beijingensis]|uniref:GNAT family N-acetyltransferase n=1 Tax=Niabella beijingensis TaxID=2872700 RepID=UPI001CBEB2F3|nr:GNAT family N-acetyltransferase [Niabella beijingensis]MBZ4190453.1 acetyltransferase [Niabella beijingensis]
MNKHRKDRSAGIFTGSLDELFLYRDAAENSPQALGIRLVVLRKDLAVLYRWVNQPYAHRFWGMQGSLKMLYEFYEPKITSNGLQLFFACIGNVPVALVEVYPVLESELAGMADFTGGDYGIHLLMAPYREIKTVAAESAAGLSLRVLRVVQRMLFEFTSVVRIVAEPDERNTNACRLAEKAGFRYIKTLPLHDKRARLYMIARDEN